MKHLFIFIAILTCSVIESQAQIGGIAERLLDKTKKAAGKAAKDKTTSTVDAERDKLDSTDFNYAITVIDNSGIMDIRDLKETAVKGALTIGTLDGANIEIMEEVGKENIFIFGLTTEEVAKLKHDGYKPHVYYEKNAELKKVVDMIAGGFFSPEEPELFSPVAHYLLNDGDRFMLMADFEDYVKCQDKVNETYKDQKKWVEMSILNVANMGKFSSDRTISEYANEIWDVKPVPIKMGK